MIINQTLQVGAEPMLSAEGSFIFVDSADGLIEITTDSGRNYSLNRWDQVQVPQGEDFKAITIRNMHDSANHVVIKTGHGKFYPANDGGSTNAVITAMPSVQFSAGQSFLVDNFPLIQSVKQSGLLDVSVNNLPLIQSVKQSGLLDVSVNNLPAIQSVSQSGQWLAQQAGLWDVSINNLPTVQKVDAVKSAIYTPLVKADFASNNHVVAENLNRKTLIIKASPLNTGAIWIGETADNGLPLFAGEKIELSTTAEVNLFAVVITDNCYLSEVN
ncbi:hypothetical protein [Psychromonas sp. Urea-02u-13]|uniref:hypothetical protein n=1 Tax=Psychromonas sp. Urea-02u-13 TaxID=2058326 RepID=UPI000C34448D|nr:hypothetical protein [Psychromonas sp. Urea-02u-13]PKG39701.1 hypothetical protein CXF74_07045 [Psychromonas sp. Urea-02u-13]